MHAWYTTAAMLKLCWLMNSKSMHFSSWSLHTVMAMSQYIQTLCMLLYYYFVYLIYRLPNQSTNLSRWHWYCYYSGRNCSSMDMWAGVGMACDFKILWTQYWFAHFSHSPELWWEILPKSSMFLQPNILSTIFCSKNNLWNAHNIVKMNPRETKYPQTITPACSLWFSSFS